MFAYNEKVSMEVAEKVVWNDCEFVEENEFRCRVVWGDHVVMVGTRDHLKAQFAHRKGEVGYPEQVLRQMLDQD